MTNFIMRCIFFTCITMSVCNVQALDPNQLAMCMTEKGWVMYGAEGCTACTTQRDYFGDAMQHIKVVYCHESAPNKHIEQCIASKIDYTPTWVLIIDGREIERLEGYQSLDVLASISDCRG